MQEIFYEETAVNSNMEKEAVTYNIIKALSWSFFIFAGITLFIDFIYLGYGGVGAGEDVSQDVIDAMLKSKTIVMLIILGLAVALVLLGVLFMKLKNRYCNDYDYTFVTGSVRASKVINGLKRKNIIVFETSDIVKLGKQGSKAYEGLCNMKDSQKIVLTANQEPSEGKEFFYMFITKDGDRKLLIFECTEQFIVNVLKYSNKTVIDEELK